MGKDMEEWNLNVDKNVVEANMIKMNKWLKEFGLTDSDWDNYQPIYLLTLMYLEHFLHQIKTYCNFRYNHFS